MTGFIGTILCSAWFLLIPLDYIFVIDRGLPSLSHFPAAGMLILSLFKAADIKFKPQFLHFISTFALVLLASGVMTSTDIGVSFVSFLELIYYMVVSTVIVWWCAKDERMGKIGVVSYVVGASIAGAYALVYGDVESKRLAIVEGANPTWLGAYQIISIYILAGFLYVYKIPAVVKAVILGLAGFGIFVLVKTQSQTAMYSFILAGGYLFLKLSARRPALGAGIALVILFGSAYFLENLEDMGLRNIERTFRCVGCTVDDVGSGRLNIWLNYLKGDIYNLFGVGLKSSQSIYEYNAPHNTYITILVELGFVGLSFFIFSIARLLVHIRDYEYTKFGVVFLLVFMVGNDLLHYKYGWVLVIVVAILYKLEGNERWHTGGPVRNVA